MVGPMSTTGCIATSSGSFAQWSSSIHTVTMHPNFFCIVGKKRIGLFPTPEDRRTLIIW